MGAAVLRIRGRLPLEPAGLRGRSAAALVVANDDGAPHKCVATICARSPGPAEAKPLSSPWSRKKSCKDRSTEGRNSGTTGGPVAATAVRKNSAAVATALKAAHESGSCVWS